MKLRKSLKMPIKEMLETLIKIRKAKKRRNQSRTPKKAKL